MIKLIVQIPCLNEEETLGETVADIPRAIPGIDIVEILVIDDGSTDGTIEAARQAGVDHVVRHHRNRGLAQAFRTGLDACLKLGADIIVNTDADNQYCGADIPKLVQPILEKRADMVIGDRQTQNIDHFSWSKKRLQKLGSFVVHTLADARVPDAVSGFRAISSDLAYQLNIVSEFSYTIESIIQTSKKRFAIESVPIRTNPTTRPSRLFHSLLRFLERSVTTMIRTYATYKPLRVFFYVGMVFLVLGLWPIARFLYFYFTGDGGGHIQSLTLGVALLILGGFTLLIGIVADLISVNRRLIETTLEKVRRLEVTIAARDKLPPADTE